MKKLISKIGRALQVILAAPVKLPGKALNVIRYIAVGIGIIESVMDAKEGGKEREGEQDEDQ